MNISTGDYIFGFNDNQNYQFSIIRNAVERMHFKTLSRLFLHFLLLNLQCKNYQYCIA